MCRAVPVVEDGRMAGLGIVLAQHRRVVQNGPLVPPLAPSFRELQVNLLRSVVVLWWRKLRLKLQHKMLPKPRARLHEHKPMRWNRLLQVNSD